MSGIKINFTGAGHYWLSCPVHPDGNGERGWRGWLRRARYLGNCETRKDVEEAAAKKVAAELTDPSDWTASR